MRTAPNKTRWRGVAVVLAVLAIAPPALAIKIQKVTSAGGLVAWLVQERTVPVISMSFGFQGAAALDPAGKEGLAEMVSGLLDEGAGELDSQAFQKRLEDLVVTLRFRAGLDRFRGSLRTLTENRDAAFRLLRLAVTSPRFDAEPVQRIRAQIIASIRSDAESPGSIAGRAWYKMVFPGHAYGRPVEGSIASVKAITRADLKGFVARHLARDTLMVAVVGDIDATELARRLDQVFGALPARAAPAALPEAAPKAAGRLVVIKRDIPQSVVLFGHGGIKRDDPDWYTANVMMRVLGGGGFSSRLTEEVREKRGLAYSVYAYLNPFDRAGLIMGRVGTANARVGQSLDIIRAEWRRMAESGVSEAELASAKTYINGSFPLRLDSTRRIARILLGVQMNDLGINYLDRRAGLINRVSAADIKRVARRLLKADQLTIVVVGDPKGVEAKP